MSDRAQLTGTPIPVVLATTVAIMLIVANEVVQSTATTWREFAAVVAPLLMLAALLWYANSHAPMSFFGR